MIAHILKPEELIREQERNGADVREKQQEL